MFELLKSNWYWVVSAWVVAGIIITIFFHRAIEPPEKIKEQKIRQRR